MWRRQDRPPLLPAIKHKIKIGVTWKNLNCNQKKEAKETSSKPHPVTVMFLPRKSEPGKQNLLSPSLEILREQVLSLSLFLEILREQVLSLSLFLVDNLVLEGKPVCISPYLLPPVCNHFCSWLSWCWNNTLVTLSVLCWCWTPGA